MDMTAVTDFITGDATTAVATVGGAALVLIIGLKVWRYLRSAA
ncbi:MULTISPECIES: major capsid protein [Spongiibacter]|nr:MULTISPECIES: major capsid protein [Spongiibacter]MAY38655.1 hypothetical protein [Spongiibacter sp.]MBI58839.1 hypothetical protein [Spongiibacter sp.]|tara:strand:- start:121 stop:249 length:129 start_codon:yes stop_codon:yes gene_type:complete